MEIDRQEAINQTKAAISNDKTSELGFQDDYQAVFSTGKGLNEDIIRQISAKKNEPQWMLDYRLQAY
ncbi:Fe-S cluster assembly protein SufB, partial [Lactococcus lactis]|nr:Fe-S cluster assembly protein SufB [Lactococcus lactis]